MKAVILLIILGMSFVSSPTEKHHSRDMDGFTTYYFIRHAEKDLSDPKNKDPELSSPGIERAKKWAQIFREVNFDAIYSTNYNRTISTASIIADSQGIEVQLYDPGVLFNEGFQEKTRGKKVLIVGHSNTNPRFVNMILGADKYSDIEEKESGSLFIVTVTPMGDSTSEVLYFN